MSAKWFFRFVLNSVAGFLLLIVFNALGSPLGIELGVNAVNSLVIGIFGVPGFALLLIVRYLLVV